MRQPVTTIEPNETSSISPPSEIFPTSSTQLRAGAALLVVVGVLIYLNSFNGQIVFDDVVITDDPSIRQLWPPWSAMFSPNQVTRPLVGLSLAINYAMSGTDLWSYHLFNLAIHILAALTLFGVVRRTLLTEKLKDRFGKASTALALAVALIWMVHPLHTESVTYLIQRSEAMCGLFYLLTLYCVIRGHSSRPAALWYTAAVLSCAAGMERDTQTESKPLCGSRSHLDNSRGGGPRRYYQPGVGGLQSQTTNALKVSCHAIRRDRVLPAAVSVAL